MGEWPGSSLDHMIQLEILLDGDVNYSGLRKVLCVGKRNGDLQLTHV